MYIINTSFVVEPRVHGLWFDFFTKKFIPHIKSEGFDVLAFTRVLHEESAGHYTYSLQVKAADIQQYQKFLAEPLAEYVETAKAMFGEQALHFTTLLKHVEY